MNFTAPTMSEWPEWSSGLPGTRNLQIHGVLKVEDGACLEATVLYDGEELVGARSRCTERSGCGQLALEASVLSASGRHTISFLVLDQSREMVDYVAEGTVLASREGLTLAGVSIPLGPTQARLEARESVTLEVDFTS